MRAKHLRHAAMATALAGALIGFGATAASAAPAATPAAAAAITCRIQVQNPHNSTHVPGTINVVATVNCTGQVSHIASFVTLYKNGAYAGSGANDVYNTSSDSVNAAAGCVIGQDYYATASAEIWYPSGPPQWTNIVNSPTYYWGSCTGGVA
jgi:hypothetical protein